MAVKPIPEGFHSLTPYLTVADVAKAIDYYKRAFGATDVVSMDGPNGQIMHAELKIGNSVAMLGQASIEYGSPGPETLGGSPVTICLYVPDVDSVFARAVAEGGTVSRPLTDQFWGDRSGQVTDPSGHRWMLATHIENVTPEEMTKRFEGMMKGQPCPEEKAA